MDTNTDCTRKLTKEEQDDLAKEVVFLWNTLSMHKATARGVEATAHYLLEIIGKPVALPILNPYREDSPCS